MLKIDNLSVTLSNRLIIDDLSLSFPGGEISCIVGKNGSGKSTLLKAIDSLIPSKGTIKFHDIDLKALSIKERSKVVSYLSQNRIIPKISVHLLVEHGRFPYLGFSKNPSEEDLRIVDESIEKVKIGKYKNKTVDTLSGGEQQKVYLASLIAQNTDVVLLDEPTTHLDLESQIEIIKIIKGFKENKKTVIVVLHDLLQAFSFFDNVYLMDNGKIIEYGKSEELYDSENIKKIFNYSLIKETDEKSLYKYKLVSEN